jgi:hypothetical protein
MMAMLFLLIIENWIYVKANRKIIKSDVAMTWVHSVLWLGAGLLIFLVFCVVIGVINICDFDLYYSIDNRLLLGL